MAETPYFDTAERSERAQLLVHLIHNTPEFIYLRGPHGAGKTRFVQQLVEQLESEYDVLWYELEQGGAIQDLLPGGALPAGPEGELDLISQPDLDRATLLIIDEADTLGPPEIQDLLALQDRHEHVLLLGTGGPAMALGGLRLQFVDLPPFTEAQTRAFIRTQGKLGEGSLDEPMVSTLHRAAQGQPGPLLDALDSLPDAQPGKKSPRRGLAWQWPALALSLLSVLVLVLVFQDRINSWFVPAQSHDPEPSLAETVEGVDSAGPDVDDGFNGSLPPDASLPGPWAEGSLPFADDIGPDPIPEPEERAEPVSEAMAKEDEPKPEIGSQSEGGVEEEADPILDAVIDAAISAAEQAPEMPFEASPVVREQPLLEPEISDLEPEPEPEPLQEPVVSVVSPPTLSQSIGPPPDKEVQALVVPRPKIIRDEGGDWLRQQPAAHYTLQLVGSRDRTAIDRFIEKHEISRPYAVFSRDLGGSPWFSLVSGSYPNREAAITARQRLPAGLDGVWPRTFGSVQSQLGPP